MKAQRNGKEENFKEISVLIRGTLPFSCQVANFWLFWKRMSFTENLPKSGLAKNFSWNSHTNPLFSRSKVSFCCSHPGLKSQSSKTSCKLCVPGVWLPSITSGAQQALKTIFEFVSRFLLSSIFLSYKGVIFRCKISVYIADTYTTYSENGR